MPPVVTLPAKRNQLEQELLARVTIGKVMNIYSLSHPAALANPLSAQHHKLPSLLPLRRLQILVIAAPPIIQQPLLLAVQRLGVEAAALGAISAAKVTIPQGKPSNVLRRHRVLANRMAHLVTASLALLSNLYLLIRLHLLAARRLLVSACECCVHLFTDGGVVWLRVLDTHAVARSNDAVSDSRDNPKA